MKTRLGLLPQTQIGVGNGGGGVVKGCYTPELKKIYILIKKNTFDYHPPPFPSNLWNHAFVAISDTWDKCYKGMPWPKT